MKKVLGFTISKVRMSARPVVSLLLPVARIARWVLRSLIGKRLLIEPAVPEATNALVIRWPGAAPRHQESRRPTSPTTPTAVYAGASSDRDNLCSTASAFPEALRSFDGYRFKLDEEKTERCDDDLACSEPSHGSQLRRTVPMQPTISRWHPRGRRARAAQTRSDR